MALTKRSITTTLQESSTNASRFDVLQIGASKLAELAEVARLPVNETRQRTSVARLFSPRQPDSIYDMGGDVVPE